MLLGQLLIGILLDQNRLLEVVYYLQDQDHLLLASELHSLQVAADYIPAVMVQIVHFELTLLVYALAD